ncbi:MAG: hypothetical protein PHV17_06810 [Candidatus Omnitrophica bacterium]|nr:hypothetical protein [Candidatus Omnitrophota bacterium]
MYLVETHGKLSKDNENKEDILTSNVFSFFKYAPRQIFLKRLLNHFGIEVSDKEAKSAEFIFWHRFQDNTEPDLVLVAGNYYLLIEAKYFSGFGQKTKITESQLSREVYGGMLEAKSMGLKFKLIAVTADYSYKESKFNEIPKEFTSDFIWTNWQNITVLISDILENKTGINPEVRLMAQDLCDLLIRKGLRNFQGLCFIKVSKKIKRLESLFFMAQTASRRGSFIGYVDALSPEHRINRNKEFIYFKHGNLFFQGQGLLSGRRIKHNKIIFFKKEGFRERQKGDYRAVKAGI